MDSNSDSPRINRRNRHAMSAVAPAHGVLALTVRDLARSERFYRELFGFIPDDDAGFCDDTRVLVSPPLANGFRSVILTTRSSGWNVSGLLLELDSVPELLDRHILARLLAAPTTSVVSRGHSLVTTIADPDGHIIELRARSTTRAEDSAAASRSSQQPVPRVRCRWQRDDGEPVVHQSRVIPAGRPRRAS